MTQVSKCCGQPVVEAQKIDLSGEKYFDVYCGGIDGCGQWCEVAETETITNNIENEVERNAKELKYYIGGAYNYGEMKLTEPYAVLIEEATKWIASLTEQHQNEKTFMLTEFENVKKLREDEQQRDLDIAFTKGEIAGLKRGQELALEALRKV